MRKVMIIYVMLFCLLSCAVADAATVAVSPAPVMKLDCQPVKAKVVGQTIELSGEATPGQVYILKNTSQKSIWLDHPVKKPSASAGWSSYLRTGNASALFL